MKPSSFIILLIASLISILLAQTCNNPLLNIYGLQGLDAPQSGADLPYCNDLRSSQTCCSADTVASFQNRLEDLIDKLNNYDAARDFYIVHLRRETFDAFENLLDDINDNRQILETIRQANASLADQLQADIDSFTQIDTDADFTNDQFRAALNDTQVARNNCFTAALQVKASSWCLACDPNYATQGVGDDGTVTFSNGLCQTISDACWPYFNQSARFNPLIRAREAYWRLAVVDRYLRNVSSTGEVGDFSIPPDPYNPLSTQLAVTVPDQWTPSAGDTEQCQNLWAGNPLLAELLTIGSSSPVESMEENELIMAEEEESIGSAPNVIVVDVVNGSRLLQDALAGPNGVWTPVLANTGMDFSDLLADPGDLFDDLTDLYPNLTDLTD